MIFFASGSISLRSVAVLPLLNPFEFRTYLYSAFHIVSARTPSLYFHHTSPTLNSSWVQSVLSPAHIVFCFALRRLQRSLATIGFRVWWSSEVCGSCYRMLWRGLIKRWSWQTVLWSGVIFHWCFCFFSCLFSSCFNIISNCWLCVCFTSIWFTNCSTMMLSMFFSSSMNLRWTWSVVAFLKKVVALLFFPIPNTLWDCCARTSAPSGGHLCSFKRIYSLTSPSCGPTWIHHRCASPRDVLWPTYHPQIGEVSWRLPVRIATGRTESSFGALHARDRSNDLCWAPGVFHRSVPSRHGNQHFWHGSLFVHSDTFLPLQIPCLANDISLSKLLWDFCVSRLGMENRSAHASASTPPVQVTTSEDEEKVPSVCNTPLRQFRRDCPPRLQSTTLDLICRRARFHHSSTPEGLQLQRNGFHVVLHSTLERLSDLSVWSQRRSLPRPLVSITRFRLTSRRDDSWRVFEQASMLSTSVAVVSSLWHGSSVTRTTGVLEFGFPGRCSCSPYFLFCHCLFAIRLLLDVPFAGDLSCERTAI